MKYDKYSAPYKALVNAEKNCKIVINCLKYEIDQIEGDCEQSSTSEDKLDELYDELKKVRRDRRQLLKAMGDLLSL